MQFGVIAEAFEAAAEADHLLKARDVRPRGGVVAEDVRQHGQVDDDGDGRVPEGYGTVGQVLIQEGDRLPQVEVRRLRGRPLHDEVVDDRGGEQDRVQVCDVVGEPLEPAGTAEVEVDAEVDRVGDVPCHVED